MNSNPSRLLLAITAFLLTISTSFAQCPATVPAQGAALPAPLPLFPPDNWWNADISTAPVDANSASFIAFINNGGTRKLHPDFGGEASPGSEDIYGMPYAIVDGSQAKQAVTFEYWDESDGVNPTTGQGIPFYPIPAEAIAQPHWIEGGAPGNVDERSASDRHLFVIDCTNRYLYELYNVYYDAGLGKWYAGSGAFFDMNTNHRRPDTWTSADAAGLAIFPGLVRYDEAWNSAVTDIGHAFRVTVRSTNGYVFPASHRAGSTSGALPLGARLRLKSNVGGLDPALRTSDPNIRKIFRAMQKYGLLVADNGSDMYITGTFDTRWNNGILNPAFATLTASDFEVVQLGWTPSTSTVLPVLNAISANPSSVVGGIAATGTVTLASPAPAGGVQVGLGSASAAVALPANVVIVQGASTATFAIATSPVATLTATTLSASYNGAVKTATFTVKPPAPPTLQALGLDPTTVAGGATSTATITLAGPAPAGGARVTLASSRPALASVPSSALVPAGATAVSFTVTTASGKFNNSATISATYGGVKKSAVLTVKRK